MAAVDFDELEAGIARITLNRPERLNAIDGAFIDGMDAALDALTGGDWRVGILTGAGRGFCAGADLSGTVFAGSAAEFGNFIGQDIEKLGKVIRAANIKPD